MTQLKILQVGCGTWGKHILRDLVKLGARVTVVTRSENGKSNAQEFGAAKVCSSIQEASTVSVPDGTYDGLIVVTPMTTHYEVIIKLNELFPSVPIFCEKELVTSVTQALALERLCGDHLFVMHKWRYHNGIIKLKEIISEGRFGKLRGIKLDRRGWGTSQKDVDSITTAIPHDLSILLEFMGTIPTNFKSVTESSGDWVFSQTLISAGSARDPFVTIDISSHSPVNSRAVQLLFENATAILNDSYDSEIKIYLYGNPQQKSPPPPMSIEFIPNMPLETELVCFLKYIVDGGEKPKSVIADSIAIIGAMESIRLNQSR